MSRATWFAARGRGNSEGPVRAGRASPDSQRGPRGVRERPCGLPRGRGGVRRKEVALCCGGGAGCVGSWVAGLVFVPPQHQAESLEEEKGVMMACAGALKLPKAPVISESSSFNTNAQFTSCLRHRWLAFCKLPLSPII